MYKTVLLFWFKDTAPELRFRKDLNFDAKIKEKFMSVQKQANQGELYLWRENINGRLAEIIVLDQFSRNIFRDTSKAFASDSLALILAQEAVASGEHKSLTPEERSFLYMPYMHSESALIHKAAEKLYADLGREDNYKYELMHKAIIDRFNRYPHRNAILGRTSTKEEIAFLDEENSSF